MTVGDLAELSCLQLATEGTGLDAPVDGGYVGDLLSVVMGNAQANQVWVTIQSHVNIIAVAALAGIPAIIIAHGYEPERETLEKAKEEGIEIFTTKLDSFSIIRTLFLEKGL